MEYLVKPLPYQFCQNCTLNGCYPWSRNPALRCIPNNGLVPAIVFSEENTPRECAAFKLVTDESWNIFVADAKKEADDREALRLRAIDQKINSNQREDALIF